MTKSIILETRDIKLHSNEVTESENNLENVKDNMEEALEATGCGKFNILITLTGGIILYAVNSELWPTGYIVMPAECDMNLDLQEKTILLTVGSVGILTTQFIWGYFSDRIGRRNLMLYSLALGFLCTILSSLAPVFWMLSLFRFLNGTCVACSSGLVFAYVGEFFSSRHRSVFMMIMSIFIGLSLTLVPLIAWLVLPMEFSFSIFGYNYTSWRIFVLLSGIPTVPAIIALYFCPESPKFLAQVQRKEECIAVLQRMHRMNGIKGTYTIEKIICDNSTNSQNLSMLQLLNSKYLLKTLVVCTLQGGIFATSGGLFLWYPDIVQKISKSSEEITACEALNLPNSVNNTITQSDMCGGPIDSSVYLQNLLIGSTYILGYVIISLLVSKVGIRNLLMISLSSSGCACVALHFVVTQKVIDILFIGMLVMSGVCVVVVNAAIVEMYPTNLRGMAVCAAMLIGRLGTIISSSVVGYLLLWNCDVTFLLYASSLIGCGLLSWLLPSKQMHDDA